MKDKNPKVRNLHASHTLGCSGNHLKIETRLIDEKFASVINPVFELLNENRVTEVELSTVRFAS